MLPSMDSASVSSLGIVAMLVAGLMVVGCLLQYPTWVKDPREPPFIPENVPLIGHLISQFTEGPAYFRRISYVTFDLSSLSKQPSGWKRP